ncbi:hypothetical protein, partial [Paracoccus sp. (in: a-proteobacteria)]|uniref:hypothetical protein n=1 Tax=Paracoccus sp. TaxID=267 RepID=UPI002897DCCF
PQRKLIMDLIKAAVMPHVLEIISILLASMLGWAANTARKKWGIDIEAKHRDALHSALMTGARLALQRGLTGQEAINQILQHIKISVPDAVIGVDARAEVLDNLAKAKLQEIAKEAGLDQLTEAMKRAGTVTRS